MNFTRIFIVASLLLISTSVQARVETMQVPTFGTISVYRPDEPPKRVVLFLSGDGGWHLGVGASAAPVKTILPWRWRSTERRNGSVSVVAA